MKQKKSKKLLLKKETISNLSKFDQGMVIGGYDAGGGTFSYAPICTCSGPTGCFSWPGSYCPEMSEIYKPCLPSTKDDGGTCDSSVNSEISCQGQCSIAWCP